MVAAEKPPKNASETLRFYSEVLQNFVVKYA